eukprot:jgi/Botrbrau1/6315/Bobra.0339s0025.1
MYYIRKAGYIAPTTHDEGEEGRIQTPWARRFSATLPSSNFEAPQPVTAEQSSGTLSELMSFSFLPAAVNRRCSKLFPEFLHFAYAIPMCRTRNKS